MRLHVFCLPRLPEWVAGTRLKAICSVNLRVLVQEAQRGNASIHMYLHSRIFTLSIRDLYIDDVHDVETSYVILNYGCPFFLLFFAGASCAWAGEVPVQACAHRTVASLQVEAGNKRCATTNGLAFSSKRTSERLTIFQAGRELLSLRFLVRPEFVPLSTEA